MLTPLEQFHNLRDSILNAALKYEDSDVELRFATMKQVQAINIALRTIVPEAKRREQRVALLACIAGRDPRYFKSSKDLTFEEASALIDGLFESTSDVDSLASVPLRDSAQQAIRFAFEELCTQYASA